MNFIEGYTVEISHFIMLRYNLRKEKNDIEEWLWYNET